MSMSRDLFALTIHNRDAGTLNQALTIVFPEQMKDKEVIIHEYDGSIPRLFGDDKTIELMLPSDMDTVVENAVVEAINNGTLFDDAEHVNNTASYITMTSYPLSGMSNKGKNEPVSIKHAIGSVVGAMNDEGRFGRDECDTENGTNFAHDIVKHGKDKDSSVNDLVDSYLDAKNHNKLSLGYRRSLNGVHEEIDDINDVTPEDSISQSDIDNGFSASKILGGKVESKGECGDVEAFDEDGDWASNVMSEVKKRTASKDAELDDIITKNKQDQDDMQKRVAEMRARVMARRNGNASGWAEEDGEMEPGEAWNEPTSGITESYTEELIQEGLFRRPKKLKPIPRDVVAYITVEMNAIKDSNDQAMLAGYTCSKLELVDFYITCIDTQDDRYIVPHTRQYLVQMQDDLNRLLTQILKIKPVNRNDRMWKVILPEGRF